MNRLSFIDILSNKSLKKAHSKQSAFSEFNSNLNNQSFDNFLNVLQESFPHTQLLGLKGLLGLAEKYPDKMFCSLATLADEAGISERTIDRMLSKLSELGLINNRRRYNNSTVRRLHKVFSYPHIKNPLKRFFANVTKVFIATSLLFSHEAGLKESGALRILNDSDINKPTVRESISTGLESKRGVFIPKKRKGIEVNKESIALLSNNLDKLPLTDRGIMKLSHFPPEVISYVIKQRLNLNAEDLFAYIWSLAKARALPLNCDDFDHSLYNKTSKALGIEHKPYIDAELFQQLQQREAMKTSHKPKFMSDNSRQTTSSTRTVVEPTAYPTLSSFQERFKNKAIAQGVYVEGMSFGDIQDALRRNYENTLTN